MSWEIIKSNKKLKEVFKKQQVKELVSVMVRPYLEMLQSELYRIHETDGMKEKVSRILEENYNDQLIDNKFDYNIEYDNENKRYKIEIKER